MLPSRLSTPRRRRGNVTVLTALCLTGMIGVAAIALDGGLLLDNQKRVQATADAAALAAATDLWVNYTANSGADPSGTASQSALTTAAANGYSKGTNGSTVTVHIPPLSGTFIGQAGYAEVIINYPQPRGFSEIFGSGPLPVYARAVARGLGTTTNVGVLVLNPTQKGSLDVTGNGNITVTAAAIIVDSNNAAGGVDTSSANVTAPIIDLSGTPGYSTSGSGQFIGTINSGQTPTPDPLAYLPQVDPTTLITHPTPGTQNITNWNQGQTLQISASGNYTLNPGVYTDGIKISGPSPGTVTLNPGIYYMQGGGFTMSGGLNLSGQGVMIYNAPQTTGDVISITGNGSVNLSAPTSGTYRGITLFQDRTSTAPVSVTGNGNMNISGTIYAAKAAVTVTGNGGVNNVGSEYVSDTLKVTGNGSVNINYQGPAPPPRRIIGLVE